MWDIIQYADTTFKGNSIALPCLSGVVGKVVGPSKPVFMFEGPIQWTEMTTIVKRFPFIIYYLRGSTFPLALII